jgi:hypothetical protein
MLLLPAFCTANAAAESVLFCKVVAPALATVSTATPLEFWTTVLPPDFNSIFLVLPLEAAESMVILPLDPPPVWNNIWAPLLALRGPVPPAKLIFWFEII